LLLLPFLAAPAFGACSSSSSSSNSDLFDGGPDVTTDDGAVDTGSGLDSAKDTAAPDTFVPFDSGPPHDAQAACAVMPTDGGDAGNDDGEAGAVANNVEVEPNDSAANANTLVLNGPECGSISPATDVDFYKFTIPASDTKWSISFDGNIKMTFTVGTDPPVVVQPGSTPSPTFHAGAEYTVQVESADGQPQAYAITITVSP
jgi:hypothetical protein